MAKKPRLRRTKRFAKRIFAFDENKRGYTYLKWLYTRAFALPSEEGSSSDFAALNLNEESIDRIKKNIKKQLMVVAIFTILAAMFSIYELVAMNFLPFLCAVAFLVAMLAVGFRYHFWLFQVKQRKLGCSVGEWYQHTFGRAKS